MVWCDNHTDTHIATNPISHEWTKHIEVDVILLEGNSRGIIDLGHIRTKEQLIDLFNKTLSGKHDNVCNQLDMFDIYSST